MFYCDSDAPRAAEVRFGSPRVWEVSLGEGAATLRVKIVGHTFEDAWAQYLRDVRAFAALLKQEKTRRGDAG